MLALGLIRTGSTGLLRLARHPAFRFTETDLEEWLAQMKGKHQVRTFSSIEDDTAW